MNIIQSAIIGLVEGLTEFLPISSTFHLIWIAKLLGIDQTNFTKMFEVVIQSGAILAVFILYFHKIIKDKNLVKNVILSFLPTAIIGYLLYKIIKDYFFANLELQLGVFFLVGIIFIMLERRWKERHTNRRIDSLSLKDALIVGLAQSLAVIPGISRAGAVLVSLICLGINREEAAVFSFLLAIPTIFSASLFDLIKMRHLIAGNSENLVVLMVGFIASFISSWIGVKWFVGYLKKHSLVPFGWYRIILSSLLISWLIFQN